MVKKRVGSVFGWANWYLLRISLEGRKHGSMARIRPFFVCNTDGGVWLSIRRIRALPGWIAARAAVGAGRRGWSLFDRSGADRGGFGHHRQLEGAIFCGGFGADVSLLCVAAAYVEAQLGNSQWKRSDASVGALGIGGGGVYVGGNAGCRLAQFPRVERGRGMVEQIGALAFCGVHGDFWRAALYVCRVHCDASDTVDSGAFVLGIFDGCWDDCGGVVYCDQEIRWAGGDLVGDYVFAMGDCASWAASRGATAQCG